jgi:hypothetical protein
MEDYKPNSHRSKDAGNEKRLEKVVTGTVRPKKKSNTEKLAELFLPEDVENLKTYVVRDILIPAGKKAVSEIIDMFLYGSTGRSTKSTNASKVSYRSYYESPNERRAAPQPRPSTGYHYDDIIFDNRGEAEEVLVSMEECIATYGMVTVRDFYDLVGVTGNHTDQKYGWLDLRTASVVRLRMGEGGYMIKLPRAVPLN